MMERKKLKQLLIRHRCSLTETGKALGVSPQRVEQLVKACGFIIVKSVEDRPKGKAKHEKSRVRPGVGVPASVPGSAGDSDQKPGVVSAEGGKL